MARLDRYRIGIPWELSEIKATVYKLKIKCKEWLHKQMFYQWPNRPTK